MKKTIQNILHFSLFALTLVLSMPTYCEEMIERNQIGNEVAESINQENFAKLEQLSATYRERQDRTSSGVWKLTVFYGGLRSALLGDYKNEAEWSAKNEIVNRWIEAYPTSPSAHLMKANLLTLRAWQYRGTASAKDTSPESWDGFNKYMKEARQCLSDKKSLMFKDPYWYELMLEPERSWAEKEYSSGTKLIGEALHKFPTYYQFSFNALNYAQAKWRLHLGDYGPGGLDTIDKLIKESTAANFSTDGNGMYARMYWYLSSLMGENIFKYPKLTHLDWDKMKVGMDDVLKQYPDDWNITHFARFACLAGDEQKTIDLLNMRKIALTEEDKNLIYARCQPVVTKKRAQKKLNENQPHANN
ncbi:hypothetical protein Meth11DRAFT_0135 [Methylophilaceae bacterium 11]|nr:hypothetical protein Meth11DRAFT_0135 [Methylophilaceae bacterium 11]